MKWFALAAVLSLQSPAAKAPAPAEGDILVHSPLGDTECFAYHGGRWLPCRVHNDGDILTSYPDGGKSVYYHDQPYAVMPMMDWDWTAGMIREGKIGARVRGWK